MRYDFDELGERLGIHFRELHVRGFCACKEADEEDGRRDVTDHYAWVSGDRLAHLEMQRMLAYAMSKLSFEDQMAVFEQFPTRPVPDDIRKRYGPDRVKDKGLGAPRPPQPKEL